MTNTLKNTSSKSCFIIKHINDSTEYLLDSFPVPMCDNLRIFQAKLIRGEQFRGYIASKKRYFYGAHDVRALNVLPLNLPPESQVFTDAAYTDYLAESDLKQSSQIHLQVMRKKNSHRQDPGYKA